MPLENHVPIDQTKKIFRNKFVVKCGITDVVNLRTYDDLELKVIYVSTVRVSNFSMNLTVFDHLRH